MPPLRLHLILLALTAVSGLTTCPRQCICHEHSIACSCETADSDEMIVSSLGSTYITSLVVHSCAKVTVLNGSFSGVVLVERLSFIAIGRLYFEPHAFKDILQSPRQLVIDECKIPSLAPVAFAGLSHIDHLWFRNSQIDVIAMEAFHYLTNIDYIYFHKTNIGRIERKAFSKMYQIDHLYFKDSIHVDFFESEAFSESQIDELIFDGVSVKSAHDTFLLNVDSESTVLQNCSVFLVPREEENVIEIHGQQKFSDRCQITSSTFNILSPHKLGCMVLEVSNSIINKIGPIGKIREPSISTSLNSIFFSNSSITSVDPHSFSNYSLSILAFNNSRVTNFQSKSIEKSRIKSVELNESIFKLVNSSSIWKSKIDRIEWNSMEIQKMSSKIIDNSLIGKLRIKNSKIDEMDKNLLENSNFGDVKIDGNRVLMMDSSAFHGKNSISSLSITANDLSTSTRSPSLLRPDSLPTSFLLANNTLDCSPTACSTNSFLLNSPKHQPLLYQISHNKCRPPSISPCLDARSTTFDTGISCRVSEFIADCACTSHRASIPNIPNISIIILGDCDQLEVDRNASANFSQIYIFRTAQLSIRSIPESLKVLKIFHSTVTLSIPFSKTKTAQDWQLAHSKIESFSVSDLSLASLRLEHSRLSGTPKFGGNSSIGSLVIENSIVESTETMFSVSASLRMAHSLVFSSPRGLGSISSAQLQNNTLLDCCHYSNPHVASFDARCDLHFYGTRCVRQSLTSNHLPITSSTVRFSVYFVMFWLFV